MRRVEGRWVVVTLGCRRYTSGARASGLDFFSHYYSTGGVASLVLDGRRPWKAPARRRAQGRGETGVLGCARCSLAAFDVDGVQLAGGTGRVSRPGRLSPRSDINRRGRPSAVMRRVSMARRVGRAVVSVGNHSSALGFGRSVEGCPPRRRPRLRQVRRGWASPGGAAAPGS